MEQLARPSIYNYQDYRKFLSDYLRFMGNSKIGRFSFRSFSESAGFKSPGFVKAVIDGKKNLSDNSISKLSFALELSDRESEFFHNLVHFNQDDSIDKRLLLASELIAKRSSRKVYQMESAHFDLYNNWYCVPILVHIGSSGFEEDPANIAKMFSPHITEGQVRKAFKTLLKLGLVERDENDKLKVVHKLLNTGDRISSLSIVKFHKKMIALGAESIDRFSADYREISCATVALDKENAEKLKKLVQDFRSQVLELTQSNESEEVEVIQMNFQMFPLTEGKWLKDAKKKK